MSDDLAHRAMMDWVAIAHEWQERAEKAEALAEQKHADAAAWKHAAEKAEAELAFTDRMSRIKDQWIHRHQAALREIETLAANKATHTLIAMRARAALGDDT